MAQPIDFYFDFTSPYGYLMSEKIDDLAAQFERQVRWHPISLGVIFKATGSQPPVNVPLKGPYTLRDFERSARFLGVPYHHPSRFPVPTQAAGRVFYWLQDRDETLALCFAHAVYRAFFVEDRDISSPEIVLDIAEELNIDRAELQGALEESAVKARFNTATAEAIERGVFGSPYILIGEEAFFGVDRLPQIEAWLETDGF